MCCVCGGILISPSEWCMHRLQQQAVSDVHDLYHVGLCVSMCVVCGRVRLLQLISIFITRFRAGIDARRSLPAVKVEILNL